MIVALAGHVDHGKTSIVRALTGVDTDRLAEEKRRGLTIDLGFAYADIGGCRIGFVDVPGHHRFVHNMVAGISANQYALLVVAADDGVMPQTREHLQILGLLGLGQGVVALTKIDRVGSERLDAVRANIREAVAGSFLADADVIPLSCSAGDGIADLRQHLGRAARALAPAAAKGLFRLAIDRAFTVRGSGVVATGTVVSGHVGLNARLVLGSSGSEVRVRAIHVQNAAADRAQAGDRAALNLAGVDIAAIRRGDWLMEHTLREPATRFAATLTVVEDFPRPVKHGTPTHIYHGTSHGRGRILLVHTSPVGAGEEAPVDIACEPPLHVKVGDRVVLRDQALERTLGGAVVLDLDVPARRRSAKRRQRLASIRVDAMDVTLAALARTQPVDAATFGRHWNAAPDAVRSAAEARRLQWLDGCLLHAELVAETAERIRATLAAWHRSEPASEGLSAGELATPGAEDATRLVLASLDADGSLRLAGGKYALASHHADIPAEVQRLYEAVEPMLDSTQPPSIGDIAKRLQRPFASVERELRTLPAFRLAVRISATRLYLPSRLLELADIAVGLAAKGPFTVRQFRDASGIGRNVVIEVLEYFDANGLTRRSADTRQVIGEPSAWQPR